MCVGRTGVGDPVVLVVAELMLPLNFRGLGSLPYLLGLMLVTVVLFLRVGHLRAFAQNDLLLGTFYT